MGAEGLRHVVLGEPAVRVGEEAAGEEEERQLEGKAEVVDEPVGREGVPRHHANNCDGACHVDVGEALGHALSPYGWGWSIGGAVKRQRR